MMRRPAFLAALVAALLLLVSAGTANADTWLSFGGVSKHLSDGDHNEKNGGFGIEHGMNEDWRLMAGTYRNSFKRNTLYVGAGYTPLHIGPVKLGAVAGLFSGYVEDVTPVVMGAAMIEWRRLGMNVLYLPAYKGQGGLVALQFKWRFQ